MWFVISSPVAPAYSNSNFNSSKTTEAVYGESLEIIDENGDWFLLKQDDGYKSWFNKFYGTKSNEKFEFNSIITQSSTLPFGSRVLKKGNKIITCDGKEIMNDNTHSFNTIPLTYDSNQLKSICLKLLGATYRWGGKTSFGFDCSGFVQSVLYSMGINLKRDAKDQYEITKNFSVEISKSDVGDLHFFGNKNIISHVGFSMGQYSIIHAQGVVKYESLNRNEINFNSKLSKLYLSTHSLKYFLK